MLLRWGDRTILTAPYFSAHSFWHTVGSASGCAAFWPLESRSERIKKNVNPPVPEGQPADPLGRHLLNTEAIFVGHGHYDHLLDIPQMVRCYAPGARVYGSSTAVSLLNQVAMDIRIYGRPACPEGAAAAVRENEFLIRFGDVEQFAEALVPSATDSEFKIRYRAVKYEHAPHLPHFDALEKCRCLLQGCYNYSPPRSSCDWIEGQTFAYFFDFFHEDQLRFRIFYNDAAGGAQYARLPDDVEPGTTNLAILTAASFDFVDDYPNAFLKAARPQYILMNHWEDFFRFNQVRNAARPAADSPDGVWFTNLNEFRTEAGKSLRANGVTQWQEKLLMPAVGGEYLLDAGPASAE